MNKAEFISAVSDKAGLSKVDTKKAIEAFTKVVTKELKSGGKIVLLGFGTFSVAQRAARQGVNPQTGKKIKIAARKVAKFKSGSELNKVVK